MAKVLEELSRVVETIMAEEQVKIKSRILDNAFSQITKCRNAGCTIPQIHNAIVLGGMEISFATFKRYLNRRKKAQGSLRQAPNSLSVGGSTRPIQDTYRDNSEELLRRYPQLKRKVGG